MTSKISQPGYFGLVHVDAGIVEKKKKKKKKLAPRTAPPSAARRRCGEGQMLV